MGDVIEIDGVSVSYRDDDPFRGYVTMIHLRGPKDYAALIVGVDDPRYGLERQFVGRSLRMVRNEMLVPVWVACIYGETLAPIETRIGERRCYFRMVAGKLEPLAEENVREQVALYRFANGLPLHNDPPSSGFSRGTK